MTQPPTTITPTKASERVEFVDILRGFALFGVLVANMAAYSGRSTNPANWNEWLDIALVNATRFLVEAKFYSLFSFLFGWGMAIQMLRAQAKNRPFIPLYLRRLTILLLIGIIHGTLIWFGDILTIYALLGFILLLFRHRSPRFLLISVGLCLLLSMMLTLPGNALEALRQGYADLVAPLKRSIYPVSLYQTGTFAEVTQRRLQEYLAILSGFLYFFGNIFAMFLLGLYVGKRRLFQNIQQHLPLIKRVALITFVVGLLFNGLFVYVSNHTTAVPALYTRFTITATRTIAAPSLMLFYVSALILLLQTGRGRQWLQPLAPVGRMALTNYLSQSLIATLIFYSYGLGFYGLTDPTFGLILTLIIYIAQIHFSRWWLEQYQFGPVEWLWRSLTYGRLQPLQRGQTLTTPSPFLTRRRQISLAILLLLALLIPAALWLTNRDNTPPLITHNQQPTPAPSISNLQSPVSTPAPPTAPQTTPATYNPSPLIANGNLPALVQSWRFEEAMRHIEILASPEYAGRMAGSPGGQAAADYIADHFAAYGLQPAGDDGTFFQNFPITYTELSAAPDLTVFANGSAVSQTRFQDYNPTIFNYAGSGSGRGQVIWLDDCQPDDFAGQNLVGKVPLCQNIIARADITPVSRAALEYGAAGLLLLTDPALFPPGFGNIYRETWVAQTIPTFRVYDDLVQDLLIGSSTTITNLLNTPDSLPLTAEVEFSLAAPAASTHQARNVLGVIPGRDPRYAHEIVIIGGHFDHLGHTPDGTIWAGANDNASGIAAMLEIARSWHENGYVPRRTVLFAAWDGEEHGLFGSTYYVQHPRYPLDVTQAAIQMDMVGTGIDTLSISSGPLADELAASAQSLGVATAVINLGRSDHVPFLEAGVASSLIIWVDEDVDIPSYHRPIDLPNVIEPAKLTAAAQVANATLLALADSEPAIRDMLASRTAAINNGDLTAFLATTHPDGQTAADTHWLTDLQQLNPQEVSLTPTAIQVQGDTAIVSLSLGLNITDTQESIPLTVRLSRTDSGWQWHGPNLHPQPIGPITIAQPPEATSPLTPTAQLIQNQLNRFTNLLDLPAAPPTTLLLLPDSSTLRATTSLGLPADQASWVEPGLVKLVYSPAISTSQQLTDTLAQLLLANAGLREADAPWLWHGLPLLLQEQTDLIATQKQLLPALQTAVINDNFATQPALDWAAVSYLQQRLGWRGLGAFIQAAGRDGVEAALQETLNTTDFAALWQQDWRSRLSTIQTQLDALLAERATAVTTNNLPAFLNTLDPTVPHLEASQTYWFRTAQQNNITDFSLTASPIALLANGNVLADVTWHYTLGDSPTHTTTLPRVFVRSDSGYRWFGSLLVPLQGILLTMRYSDGQTELAQTIQQDAEIIYTQLAAQLQIANPAPLAVELYTNAADMGQAIAPNFGTAGGWTTPNAGIKLLVNDDYQSALALQLTRQLLHQMGVGEEWLLKGVSLLLSRQFDRGQALTAVSTSLHDLQTAAQNDTLPDLFTLPNDDQLSDTRRPLVQAAAWDAVRYLVETYGWDTLLALLQDPSDATSHAQMGLTLPAFALTWRDSLAQGHVQPEWVTAAQGFEVATAIAHLNALTNPDWNGRLAGTDGAEQAADYIAAQFASYGLQPAGDSSSYVQPFPITHTALLYAPRLALVFTTTAQTYTYRQEFLLARPALTSTVSADLVWLNSLEAAGNLDGKIVLMPPPPSLNAALRQLAERGAVGLILPTFKREEADLWGKRPILPTDLAPLPVYELTAAGYTRFLETLDLNRADMEKLPPYHPLNITAHLDAPLSPPTPTTSANILALLPGSDPFLSQEIIIIGAHYDHVGNDPPTLLCPATATGFPAAHTCATEPGLTYTGANDNASGIATLLALAQTWQEIGYQPKHTVLFAAWGAQEMGQLGSTYYTLTPTQPLSHTIAMLQLDGVGGGDGFSLGAQGDETRDGRLLHTLNTAATALDEQLVLAAQTTNSDQIPFREAGLPTLVIAWRLADENNLPDTAAFAVHEERLAAAGRLLTLALMTLAR
ncbi:MAG: M20/M25/M40 family metallo-hydrolase [Ardenticatenaceae bacterium]|nr:M20/M25/M40 family metallo-hydrolase [Ardenticatenaceae bacterium]